MNLNEENDFLKRFLFFFFFTDLMNYFSLLLLVKESHKTKNHIFIEVQHGFLSRKMKYTQNDKPSFFKKALF